jgi:hypothetical protein
MATPSTTLGPFVTALQNGNDGRAALITALSTDGTWVGDYAKHLSDNQARPILVTALVVDAKAQAAFVQLTDDLAANTDARAILVSRLGAAAQAAPQWVEDYTQSLVDQTPGSEAPTKAGTFLADNLDATGVLSDPALTALLTEMIDATRHPRVRAKLVELLTDEVATSTAARPDLVQALEASVSARDAFFNTAFALDKSKKLTDVATDFAASILKSDFRFVDHLTAGSGLGQVALIAVLSVSADPGDLRKKFVAAVTDLAPADPLQVALKVAMKALP